MLGHQTYKRVSDCLSASSGVCETLATMVTCRESWEKGPYSGENKILNNEFTFVEELGASFLLPHSG